MIDPDPAATPAVRLDNVEELALKEQLSRGDLTGLRAYLARTREQRDWQDRIFILDRVAQSIRPEVLDFACEVEPDSADLHVIRAAHAAYMAIAMGAAVHADRPPAETAAKIEDAIQTGRAALDHIAKLDGGDPTAFALMMPAFMIYAAYMPLMRRAFQHVVLIAPSLVRAHWAVIFASSERWYGTHEGSLEMARKAMEHHTPGGDLPACLFWAHLQICKHYEQLDPGGESAQDYVQSPDIKRELEQAFDHWITPSYVPRRSSITYLGWAGQWFYQARDRERVQRVLHLTQGDYAAEAWLTEINYRRAERFAAGEFNPDQKPDPFPPALELLGAMPQSIREGKLSLVETHLGTVRHLQPLMSGTEAAAIQPLLLLQEAFLRRTQNQPEEARRLLDEAVQQVESAPPEPVSVLYCEYMARAFMRMADARHAIPFWEQALQLGSDTIEAVMQAEMMLALGNCYLTSGLSEHAAIPLRAAVRIYRQVPSDPHLPNALMALGTALKNSYPAEAESLYRESADLYSSQMKLESATSPWLNLGVLCSQAGRYAEAAELYERVLRIREQAPATSPASLATLLNNMGSNYRRMKKIPEAHAAIDRALQLLPPGDPVLASVFGTRGLVYLDQDDDASAVHSLQCAIQEYRRQPSPNLTSMAEDMERLIGALTRLGQAQEAQTIQQQLDELRAKLQATPQSRVDPAVHTQIAGALLIELVAVRNLRGKSRHLEIQRLLQKLRALIRSDDLGYYRGWASIPESTTLIFHTASPEELWSAIASCVMAEPIAAGARITIRNGATHREVFVPTPTASRN